MKIPMGYTKIEIAEKQIRNLQLRFLKNTSLEKDKKIIDAILSYFVLHILGNFPHPKNKSVSEIAHDLTIEFVKKTKRKGTK